MDHWQQGPGRPPDRLLHGVGQGQGHRRSDHLVAPFQHLAGQKGALVGDAHDLHAPVDLLHGVGFHGLEPGAHPVPHPHQVEVGRRQGAACWDLHDLGLGQEHGQGALGRIPARRGGALGQNHAEGRPIRPGLPEADPRHRAWPGLDVGQHGVGQGAALDFARGVLGRSGQVRQGDATSDRVGKIGGDGLSVGVDRGLAVLGEIALVAGDDKVVGGLVATHAPLCVVQHAVVFDRQHSGLGRSDVPLVGL